MAQRMFHANLSSGLNIPFLGSPQRFFPFAWVIICPLDADYGSVLVGKDGLRQEIAGLIQSAISRKNEADETTERMNSGDNETWQG